ncbi:MAG: glutamate racemase [Desulfobacterales bacterium]
MSLHAPIGILDSGLGGLPVARLLMERLPHISVIYYGDTARSPYGTKSAKIIQAGAQEAMRALRHLGTGVVVVTCHTIAACAPGLFRSSDGSTVLDIVTATIDEALRVSPRGRFGIIGPQALVDAGAYERLGEGTAEGARVFHRSSPLLEPLVEEGRIGKPETALIVKKYLRSLTRHQVDVLIPASGHYVPLYPLLKRKAGQRVKLLDPVLALVDRVAAVVDGPADSGSQPAGSFRALLTDAPDWTVSAARRLFKGPVAIETIR